MNFDLYLGVKEMQQRAAVIVNKTADFSYFNLFPHIAVEMQIANNYSKNQILTYTTF